MFAPSLPLTLPQPKRPAALAVAAVHLAMLGFMLQSDLLRRVLPEPPPVPVSLLALAPASPAQPLAAAALPVPARGPAPAWPMLAPPLVEVVATPRVTTADAAPAVFSTPPQAPAPVVAPPAPAPAPAPFPPTEPRPLPPGAISYRVPPAIAVPLASRRLRESGTVWLRVRVDRQGLPTQITLHRSSGFSRLDEQAVAAMQAARFTPQTENGQPIEWIVIAPLAYDVD